MREGGRGGEEGGGRVRGTAVGKEPWGRSTVRQTGERSRVRGKIEGGTVSGLNAVQMREHFPFIPYIPSSTRRSSMPW